MDRDLQLLFELGTLRFVPRTWNQLHDPKFANVAEHMFRMLWIALILAKREGADVDKVLKIALVHDITESRTGDVHTLTRHYVQRDEESALADMMTSTSFESEAKELMEEYHKRETLEAKVVKDADTLDVDMELRELTAKGGKYPKTWDEKRRQIVEHDLYTESARKMWHEINAADPYEWYADGIERVMKRKKSS